MNRLLLITAALVVPWLGFAQPKPDTAPAEFDVASLKLSPRLRDGGIMIGKTISPGRVSMLGVTPKALLMWAYGLKEYETGGPPSISTEWYDLEAKTAGPTSEDRMRLMLRSLLTQRFKLTVHTEAVTKPVYLLVVARNGPGYSHGGSERRAALHASPPRRECKSHQLAAFRRVAIAKNGPARDR